MIKVSPLSSHHKSLPHTILNSTSTFSLPEKKTLHSKLPSPLPPLGTTVCCFVFFNIISLSSTKLSIDVHAFLAWFDISFDCTHKQVKFSTGPHAQYTHWKFVLPFSTFGIKHLLISCSRQTVFYTPTTMTVSQGDPIIGHLSCSPNARNNRDLDIIIKYRAGNAAETTIQYKMCVFQSTVFRFLHLIVVRG